MPNYRRSRVPGLIDGAAAPSNGANGLAVDGRYHPARLRIPRLVSGFIVQGETGDAWLDSVTPFITVTNLPATFEAWLDSVTPFTEMV